MSKKEIKRQQALVDNWNKKYQPGQGVEVNHFGKNIICYTEGNALLSDESVAVVKVKGDFEDAITYPLELVKVIEKDLSEPVPVDAISGGPDYSGATMPAPKEPDYSGAVMPVPEAGASSDVLIANNESNGLIEAMKEIGNVKAVIPELDKDFGTIEVDGENKQVVVKKDDEEFIACFSDFENIFDSDCAFGPTPEMAVEELKAHILRKEQAEKFDADIEANESAKNKLEGTNKSAMDGTTYGRLLEPCNDEFKGFVLRAENSIKRKLTAEELVRLLKSEPELIRSYKVAWVFEFDIRAASRKVADESVLVFTANETERDAFNEATTIMIFKYPNNLIHYKQQFIKSGLVTE